MNKTSSLKPVMLYDHLPGILAGYPAVLFAIIALLSLFAFQPASELVKDSQDKALTYQVVAEDGGEDKTETVTGPFYTVKDKGIKLINSHMLFWVGLSIMIVWYIAFRFNLPKSKFWMIFGLLGTFVGIPVVLEITGFIKPFTSMAAWLGHLAPEVNSGAWFAMSLVFTIIWLGNYIWSRTHLRVRMDESGLTVNRLGGKGERFELIGLKTENEPLDYLELFLCGVGSLALKTRMNKPIFTMKRVVGLYRVPICPFFGGKLKRIEQMLSYQGKVVSVDQQDAVEAMDAEDAAEDDHDHDHDDFTGEEMGGADEGGRELN